jgi:hypothetical protein
VTLKCRGRWFNFEPNADGSIPGFKLSRMSDSNPAYQAELERVAKDIQLDLAADNLTTERHGPILKTLFVNKILMDWRNIQDEDGNEIPLSKENAMALFNELPDLYVALRELASKMSSFRGKELEAIAKK